MNACVVIGILCFASMVSALPIHGGMFDSILLQLIRILSVVLCN